MERVCNDEQERGRSRRRSSRRIQVLLYGGCWCLYVQKVTDVCWEGQREGSVLTKWANIICSVKKSWRVTDTPAEVNTLTNWLWHPVLPVCTSGGDRGLRVSHVSHNIYANKYFKSIFFTEQKNTVEHLLSSNLSVNKKKYHLINFSYKDDK